MEPGDILSHDRFYQDSETAAWKRKFLVLLARAAGNDWVARLLTSQAAFRPEQPACHHGDPYPGYYLGIPGGLLTKKTWDDLRALEDLDDVDVRGLIERGTVQQVNRLPRQTLIAVLECAAAAPDSVELASGNAFKDLGFPDAEERTAKVALAVELNRIVKARRLTQAAAARLVGVTQPKISAVARYDLDGFSVERLMSFLTALGHDVEITIRARRSDNSEGRIRVAAG